MRRNRFHDEGGDAHRYSCYSLTNGSLIWEVTYPEQGYVSQDISDKYPVRPIATSCIAGNLIISVGFGGSVRCMDLISGALQWEYDLVRDYGAIPMQFGFASSPWTDGKQVVVAAGGNCPILVSMDVLDGHMLWKSENGRASFTSPILMQMDVNDRSSVQSHLVYAAADKVISVDSSDGKTLWSFDYKKKGVTNCVTPLQVASNRLLVAGQGMDGTALIRIEIDGQNYKPVMEWHNRRIQPFYCNWTQLTTDSSIVVTSSGKLLTAFEWATGKMRWQKRGWTDSNVAVDSKAQIIVVRGDGAIARTSLSESTLEVEAAKIDRSDRVWAPPTIVGDRLLLCGRNEISCTLLNSLNTSIAWPEGTGTTAMDEMYGSRSEAVESLLKAAKTRPLTLTYNDYLLVADNRSVRLGEGDYVAVIDELIEGKALGMASQIAQDWSIRFPASIPAWEKSMDVFRREGRSDLVQSQIESRMVEISIEVEVPSESSSSESADTRPVYVTGNAKELGSWDAKGFQLVRTATGLYTAKIRVPRGDLQFKVTRGSWESVEVRTDGRSTSNRRTRVENSETVRVKVQAWKSTDKG